MSAKSNFSPRPLDRLLTEAEVAEILGVSKSWLQKRRFYGAGSPPLRKIGARIRYAESDLRKWIENHPLRTAV